MKTIVKFNFFIKQSFFKKYPVKNIFISIHYRIRKTGFVLSNIIIKQEIKILKYL